jgi:cystathionine gamma-synthase
MAIENFISHSAPFGEAVPAGSPHAVSVSLPTQSDVQRLFRDHDTAAWSELETTYPRFGAHPFIRQALEINPVEEGRTKIALSSPEAAERLINFVQKGELLETVIEVDSTMTFLSFAPKDSDSLDILTVAMKVTGGVPSSRRAEDFLRAKGVVAEPYEEAVHHTENQATVARDLQRIYAPAYPEVVLANSGMSAISATVEAVHEIRNQAYAEGETGRNTWLLLGNLYRDTEDLIMSMGTRPDVRAKAIRNASDLDTLRNIVEVEGDQIAGVIIEAPTNPLLDVPDLEQTKAILGEIPLVVDVSSAGSVLVDALPHADVIVESLTKFASGHGDMMMGAVIVNSESRYGAELNDRLPRIVEPPYDRDVMRLAYELTGWQERAAKTGKNVVALADFFESHKKIKAAHWTGSEKSQAAYGKLARDAAVNAGLITLEIKRTAQPTYDRLDLSKGPSFGTKFTLNTDFVGIVYPQEIRDRVSRAMLERRTGLTPRMLRVSVGTEDPDWLIDRYDTAFS